MATCVSSFDVASHLEQMRSMRNSPMRAGKQLPALEKQPTVQKAAVPVVKSASPVLCPLEALKAKLAKNLIGSASDGTLRAGLEVARPLSPMEALKLKLQQGLVRSARSGELATGFAKLSQPSPLELARLKMQNVLVKSSRTGELASGFAKLAPKGMEQARANAKELLVQSLRDGSLDTNCDLVQYDGVYGGYVAGSPCRAARALSGRKPVTPKAEKIVQAPKYIIPQPPASVAMKSPTTLRPVRRGRA